MSHGQNILKYGRLNTKVSFFESFSELFQMEQQVMVAALIISSLKIGNDKKSHEETAKILTYMKY